MYCEVEVLFVRQFVSLLTFHVDYEYQMHKLDFITPQSVHMQNKTKIIRKNTILPGFIL